MPDDQTDHSFPHLPRLSGLMAIAKLLAHQAAREAATQFRLDLAAVDLAVLSTASIMTTMIPPAAVALSTTTST